MAKASEWEAWVASWRASGKTSTDFCKGHGYSAKSLVWWSSQLRRKRVEKPKAEGVRLARVIRAVHVSDPSWVDASLDPRSEAVDADYWAIHTGGVGTDVVAGYSLVDLELVIVANKTGLLDITLDKIISSSCSLEFESQLSASAEVTVSLEVAGKTFSAPLTVERY